MNEVALHWDFSFILHTLASTRKDVRKEKAIEKARDSELVAKLVMLNRDSSIKSVLAEMSIPVWIKVGDNIFSFLRCLIFLV